MTGDNNQASGGGSVDPIGDHQDEPITAHQTISAECGTVYNLLIHAHDVFESVVSWVSYHISDPVASSGNNVASFGEGSNPIAPASSTMEKVVPVSDGQHQRLDIKAPNSPGQYLTNIVGYNASNKPVASTSVPLQVTPPKTTK